MLVYEGLCGFMQRFLWGGQERRYILEGMPGGNKYVPHLGLQWICHEYLEGSLHIQSIFMMTGVFL